MSRSLHLSANALFGAAFLVGLSCVWTGLSALVLGHGGTGRGLPALAGGFATWLALALVTGARRR